MIETYKFVSTAIHQGGEVSTATAPMMVRQVDAIATLDVAFDIVTTIQTMKLYRVENETAELVHVQTWTRKEVAV